MHVLEYYFLLLFMKPKMSLIHVEDVRDLLNEFNSVKRKDYVFQRTSKFIHLQ